MTKSDQLIAAGLALFNQFGIRKVSVEDVCKHGDVSKGTFYKCFKNKNALLVGIVEQLISDTTLNVNRIFDESSTFQQLVLQTLELKASLIQAYAPSFLAELYASSDAGIKDATAALTAQAIENSKRLFLEGRKSNDIPASISYEVFQYLLQKMDDMDKDPALIALIPDHGERRLFVTQQLFYGICQP